MVVIVPAVMLTVAVVMVVMGMTVAVIVMIMPMMTKNYNITTAINLKSANFHAHAKSICSCRASNLI